VQTLATLRGLETLVRTVAIAIGVLVAVAIPAGYFAAAYLGKSDERQYEARLSASALSKYAYVHDSAWRFNKLRLAETISFIETAEDSLYQTIYDERGSILLTTGETGEGPFVVGSAPILVGSLVLGRVKVRSSLRPVLSKTAMAAIVGALLGITTYLVVHHLPIRALRQALDQLRLTHLRLTRQISETRDAYEQLQQQYRLTEETADELARAVQRVELASRTKSEFLANMSHELRTPLNAIIGFSDILRNETFGPSHPSYRDYAKDIHDSGAHLLQIINDILDMSKIEAGKLGLRAGLIELRDIIHACQRLMRERAQEAGVVLVYEPGLGTLPKVSGDSTKLKQILLNLLSNGVKFTPRGGSVTVATAWSGGDRISLQVRDTGIGMSAEDTALALEPFRQIDNSHTRKYQGTGLGLPLVKALTELHGGELKIESTPGSGTTITILLPVAPTMTASALEASVPASR
jgi:signal transduction histidine kinase